LKDDVFGLWAMRIIWAAFFVGGVACGWLLRG